MSKYSRDELDWKSPDQVETIGTSGVVICSECFVAVYFKDDCEKPLDM